MYILYNAHFISKGFEHSVCHEPLLTSLFSGYIVEKPTIHEDRE